MAQAVRRRRKEARPAELLEAAFELFVERGFAATRIAGATVDAPVLPESAVQNDDKGSFRRTTTKLKPANQPASEARPPRSP